MRYLPGPALFVGILFPASAAPAYASTSRCDEVRATIQMLQEGVDRFTSELGRAPTSIEELLREDVLDAARGYTDPWGNALVLRPAPDGRAAVVSAGPDGTLDTADDLSSGDPAWTCPQLPSRESRTVWIVPIAGALGLALAAVALLRRRKRTPAR